MSARRTAPGGGVRTRLASDGIAWITLERPQSGNRITAAMAQALCDSATDLEYDEAVRVVVIGAAGRHFCLGSAEIGARRPPDWVDAIARLTRPVIAAVQGDAIAEGLELALACDVRVLSTRARCALPQVVSGQLPAYGGTQRLPRLVGRTRALDLLLTGRVVAAAEAEGMGLASRVVAPGMFRRSVRALARELAAKGPIALRYAKEAVLKGIDLTLDQGMRLEEDLYVLLQTTRDRREGIHAFLQQRKPEYRGH